MSRNRTRPRKERPATAQERAAMTFAGIPEAQFEWTNEEWALRFLPVVRAASVMLEHDDKKLEEFYRDLDQGHGIPEFLEAFASTERHLAALVKMVNAALTRSFLIVERLGYSPHNPPSGSVGPMPGALH
jgi:hypothetical protein